MRTRLLSVCTFALCTVALLGLAPTASALEVELDVGLGGLVPSEGWTPLKIRCRLGPNDPPLNGRVILDRPRLAVSAYAAPLKIEPGGVAVVRLTVPVGAGKSYAVRIEDGDGNTVTTVEPTAPWQPLESGERMAITLGEGLTALAGKGKRKPRLARVSPLDLPRDARVLDPVSAIFLPGDASAQLFDLCHDARAVDALERYVADGGRLIFVARPGVPPPWSGGAAELLLPVEELTLRAIGGSELEFLLGSVEAGDYSVLSGRLRPLATWSHRSGDVGLIAERPLGAGSVSFVGFDVEDSRVRDSSSIESVLTTLAPARTAPALKLSERRLHKLAYEAFQGRRPLSPLAFGLLALAVTVHILVLGPLAGFTSKRRGPWRGLLLPPLVSLLLGSLILLVAAGTRGEPEARSLAFVVHGDQRSSTQLELALFAGSNASFSVDIPAHLDPTLQERGALDYMSFRAPSPTLEFNDGLPTSLAPIAVSARGFSQLRLRGRGATAPDPGLRLRTSQAEADRVELRNEGTQVASNLTLVSFQPANATWQLLPALAAGEGMRLNPRSGAPVRARGEVDLDGDLFDPEDVFALPAFSERVAGLLFRAYKRAPMDGKTRLFPSSWVVVVDYRTPFPLAIRDGDAPLAADRRRAITVHMIPLEDS